MSDGANEKAFSLTRVFDRLTRPPLLTIFAVLLCLSIGVVVGSSMLTRHWARESEAAPLIGDYMAFFTGAALVHSGRGGELYDFAEQEKIQEAYAGRGLATWQPYLNPPALALALSPAVDLGYLGSFVVFSLSMAVILVAALVYLLRATPALARSRWSAGTAILLTLGFLPVALTTFGGQNTALTLALLAGIYAATRLRHLTVAGILLGLLTFKPQYAVIVGILLALRREHQVVLVAALVALLHFGLGAMVSGVRWPLELLSALSEHGSREMAENAPWHFSLPAVVHRSFAGPAAWPFILVGGAAIAGFSIWASRQVSTQSVKYPAFFGLVVTTALILSPHLQYYEAGILTLPVLLGIENTLDAGDVPSLRARLLLALGYVAYPVWRLSDRLGLQPLFIVLLAIHFWMGYLVLKVGLRLLEVTGEYKAVEGPPEPRWGKQSTL